MDISVLHLNDLSTAEVNRINAMRSYVSTRKIKNLRQQDIAQKMGIDFKEVSAIERKYSLSFDTDIEASYKQAVESLLAEGGSK